MKSSIAIIIFNRPDHAKQLRKRLRSQESRELFVISDGARDGRTEEIELVEECRQIFKDWPGTIHTLYAENNMGCKSRVSSGLDWVFERTDQAIILEDDCLPHPDFFLFCDEMLEAYSKNKTVMSVCGTKTFPKELTKKNYTFLKYNNCWGWATWKRAWKHYDDTFSAYSTRSLLFTLKKFLGSYRAALYWYYILQKVLSGSINSWAYCWMLTCFLHNGLHVYPSQNLIINSGFGENATHTGQPALYMPQSYDSPMSFPVTFSGKKIQADSVADKWIEDHMYSKSIGVRMLWILQKIRISLNGQQ